MRKFKVLLVEDDEVDIMNLQRAFKKNGFEHQLEIAHDGEEALNKIKDEGFIPHFVITDINMPRMSGLELLEEIRNDDRLADMTVFVMTTSSQDKDINEAARLNAAGYIVKPLSFDEYFSTITTLNNYWQICHTNKS